MDNLEYIDTYFNGNFSPVEKQEFEQKITTDPVFAEEVAFYLSSKQAAGIELSEQKQRFKEVYANYKPDNQIVRQRPALSRGLWPWAAAAALLAGIIFGRNAWFKPVAPNDLADKYIEEHFHTLPVTMGNREDSLQAGLRHYNEGRLDEALKRFEDLVTGDTSFIDAKKYAGIVSLRLEQYDKAINYFSQLENYSGLYANPGKFYHALALMKRKGSGDKQKARVLLEQVVKNDLEGKQEAEKWLKKW